MNSGKTQIVELVGGPLDGARWQLLPSPPTQLSIVVPPNHCGPQLPARTVRCMRVGDGKFRYDPNYGK